MADSRQASQDSLESTARSEPGPTPEALRGAFTSGGLLLAVLGTIVRLRDDKERLVARQDIVGEENYQRALIARGELKGMDAVLGAIFDLGVKQEDSEDEPGTV